MGGHWWDLNSLDAWPVLSPREDPQLPPDAIFFVPDCEEEPPEAADVDHEKPWYNADPAPSSSPRSTTGAAGPSNGQSSGAAATVCVVVPEDEEALEAYYWDMGAMQVGPVPSPDDLKLLKINCAQCLNPTSKKGHKMHAQTGKKCWRYPGARKLQKSAGEKEDETDPAASTTEGDDNTATLQSFKRS